MNTAERDNGSFLFQAGQEIRLLSCGSRSMAVPEGNIAAIKELHGKQPAKYSKQGSVPLRDLGRFWSDLSDEFNGPLADYSSSFLKKMSLPVMVPKGIGFSELPDTGASFLVVLSSGNWHGVVLASFVEEQPILLGNFDLGRNGDVAGQIERTNLDAILLIDVVSLLKREGFLTFFPG